MAKKKTAEELIDELEMFHFREAARFVRNLMNSIKLLTEQLTATRIEVERLNGLLHKDS